MSRGLRVDNETENSTSTSTGYGGSTTTSRTRQMMNVTQTSLPGTIETENDATTEITQ